MAQGFTQTYTSSSGGTAGGDLSGTYPNPTVAKINGVALSTTTATSGAFLQANGTQWTTSSSVWPTTGTQGGIVYCSASNTFTQLAKDTNATRYLSNTGSSNNPAWAQVDLTNGVTGILPVANGGTAVAASNPVIQRVSTQTGVLATGSTATPFDNTIPQNTEGTQFQTLSITPKNSSNILVIQVVHYYSSSAASRQIITALFQDSTANALAVGVTMSAASAGTFLTNTILYVMTAGTTSSTTFKVRSGDNGGNTTSFNGSNGSSEFNGTLNSIMMITEYSA